MEILIGIAGLLIAWLTYHKTFNTAPNVSEDKNNFLGYFKATQKLHLEVQTIIQKYIDEKDGASHFLYPNITFKQYLDQAKIEFEKGLSDKLYKDFESNNTFTKSNYETFLKSLEVQNNALTQFKNQLLFL